jgi:hypothetical protein
MMIPMNSFKERLVRCSEINEAANKNLGLYEKSSNPILSEIKERVPFLTMDNEGVCLVSNGQGGAIVIHSITNLGGNFARPEDKMVCLQGLANTATPLVMDIPSLLQPTSYE